MTRVFATIARLVLGGLLLAVLGLTPVSASVPVPPLTSPVIDTTGTLAAADIALLERQARALQRSSGSQLQILMLSSTGPQPIEDFAQRVFDEWRLGRKDVDDGLLLLVAKDDRKVRIHTGTGLETVITDVTAARLIQEYLVPKFRRGDYAGGLGDATLVIASLMNGEPLPAPMAAQGSGRFGAGMTVLLALGVMAALLVPIGILVFVLSSTLTLAARGGARGIVQGGDPDAVERDASGLRSGGAVKPAAPVGWWTAGIAHRGGSGGGWSGGGWSGGGGSSRGGGASGGW